jgi:hypothetical protein
MEGAIVLANGNFSHMTVLDLNFNRLGPEGAEVIANGNLNYLIAKHSKSS